MIYERILRLVICIVVVTANSTSAAQANAQSAAGSGARPATTPPAISTGAASPDITGSTAVAQVPRATGATMPISPGSELTLKRAISIALKYHPRIREAAENTNAASERVGEARSLLGPQVLGVGQDLGSTFNGIANTSWYDPEGAFPRMTGRNHDLPENDFSQSWSVNNNYMSGVSVSQFLFDFGRRRGFVVQRRFEAAAVAADEDLAKLDLIFEVSQRYFQVLQAKALIRVYEKAVEQRRYHLHEAQVKAKAGLRPELDVYVTQAEVERAELHLVDARNAYADAKAALNNAMGLSDRAPEYHLADILTYSPVTETLRVFLAQALQQRPDLKALGDQARAMGARIVQYKSDYYPTVNAMGGYSAVGTGLPAANNLNVGIVITWPIFNGFLTSHQVAEATAEQRALQDGIEDLQQRVILEVQTAFLDLQAALQRINRAEKALVASTAQLELAEKRYETGLTDIVELEDAQRYYTYDEATYAVALYGFSEVKASVDRATGQAFSGT
jgi:outer membrane protein